MATSGTSVASKRSTASCRNGQVALRGEALQPFRKRLVDGWLIVNEHHIEKLFRFDNFLEALRFTNRVGELAEKEGHHPNIHLSWGMVKVSVWTHKIDGLTEIDFDLAAKIEKLFQ
jgi:4a-hydroxytetrahydrobiopterin dehydratase